MQARRLSPYLTFNGTARAAMEFYQGILGGDLTIQTFGEAVPSTPPESADDVMHAQLNAGDVFFMASDGGDAVTPGTMISMSLDGNDREGLTEVFEKLAKDGRVIFPLEKQMWGDTFGILQDVFGVQWMVNISDAV